MEIQRFGVGRKALVIAATLAVALVEASSASADLSVTQTASPKWAAKGQLVTITATVTSTGPSADPSDVHQVELFSLRAGGEGHVNNPYRSVTPSQGTCQINPTGKYQVADCDLGDMAPGAEAQIVTVVQLNEPMNHVVAPAIAATNWSELSVAVTSPPVLTGPRQIRLLGLPAGCAAGSFSLTILAKVPRAKKVVAHMFLGFDNQGAGVDWRRSAAGSRLRVTVPISRIYSPSIGKTYTLQIYVQRRANTTLGRTVTFGLCQTTVPGG
jgi:Domain of unknown function DUF11